MATGRTDLIAGFANLWAWFLIDQDLPAAAVTGLDYLMTASGNRYFSGSRAAPAGAAGTSNQNDLLHLTGSIMAPGPTRQMTQNTAHLRRQGGGER